jgi:adenosylcobinamide kinase / adenosylcobinamide-phosphate guanylyltransferase
MQNICSHPVTLVLGGVRSGKSSYAQRLGANAARVTLVATARASDEEMRQKIERHRATRPPQWQTLEEPLELPRAITTHGPHCDLMIVDCLTIYAANLLEATGDDAGYLAQQTEELCRVLARPACSVVLVSNEVGSGVVPPYAVGRRFRDLLGELNQQIAATADAVVLMVAGLPLVLKGSAEALR